MDVALWTVVTLGVVLVAVAICWRPVRRSIGRATLTRARRDFHICRERLEAKFFDLASSSGRPRGLRWIECDFEDGVVYARNRRTSDIAALVAVTIAFEAIEGGPMEGVEAVSNLRAATAVFVFRNGVWKTEGRVVFNLNPSEAIAHYQDDLEPVATETAQSQ